MLNGFDLVECKTMTGYYVGMKLVPVRKSKSKRIQKKFIKNYGYLPQPLMTTYVTDNKIIGHPQLLKKIIKLAKEEGRWSEV